jgi:transmembrane sensor
MSSSDPGPPEPDLQATAAAWFHRLAGAGKTETDATRRLFQQWLDASSEHADAFARVTAAWNDVGEHASAPEMMALRQAAIADSQAAALARFRPPSRTSETPWQAAIAACLMLALAGVGWYFLFQSSTAQTYQTEIGRREAVTLSDNSHVDIDADSEIAVAFTPDRRLVHVVRGQAYFQVSRDPTRPFVVESAGRHVVATGTAFDVERLEEGIRVTLVEGHVLVRRLQADAVADALEMAPGDQLTDVAEKAPKLEHLASTLAAIAWRAGKLLFNDEPLSEAVARMNRYSRVQVVADPEVADVRIGGAFNAGDIGAFTGALRSSYAIDAISDRAGEVRLIRRH